MPKGSSCLTCDHVKFIQPPDWRPRYTGETFERHDVVQAIRETKLDVRALCTFNPTWIDVTTAHYCGQWAGNDHTPVEDIIWGSWLARANNELVDEVKALKAKLKNSRRISASRLAKLQERP